MRVGAWVLALSVGVLSACSFSSNAVLAIPESPQRYLGWDCARLDEESWMVQRRAADLAYAVDQQAGQNIVALGVGLAVFWPALLAMRPDGLEAAELAQLKGRHEAMRQATALKRCPPPVDPLPAELAQQAAARLGDTLVYEEKPNGTAFSKPRPQWVAKLVAARRGEMQYEVQLATGAAGTGAGETGGPISAMRHDQSGNVLEAPPGYLVWPNFLRVELALGQVVAGEVNLVGPNMRRARLRGQVVAVGPQQVAGRSFDVAVIELYGDTPLGEDATRVDGALVVDRRFGFLLRLDLRSAEPAFNFQRRLVEVR